MKNPKNTALITEDFQNAIIIDAAKQETNAHPAEIPRICWNTGEEKTAQAATSARDARPNKFFLWL